MRVATLSRTTLPMPWTVLALATLALIMAGATTLDTDRSELGEETTKQYVSISDQSASVNENSVSSTVVLNTIVSGTPTGCTIGDGNTDQDGDGYSDPDGSWGTTNGADAFPTDDTQWADSDGDGYGDNPPPATSGDACPSTNGDSDQDRFGCTDSDGDGYGDNTDLSGGDVFPNDPTQWSDRDGDGYGDEADGTNGDAFPDDPDQWQDADGDGVGDNQADPDGDAFPEDPTQWSDRDRDGFGDAANGVRPDDCPDANGFSSNDRRGCPDQDLDGWSDPDANWLVAQGADAFPTDRTQWEDFDGDGYGDNRWTSGNWDMFPYDVMEWNDTDGDGRGDNSDWDIYDRDEWEDSDGDGVGDNADVYPDDSRRSAEGDMLEPGKQFFLVVVVFLSAIVILYPKGIEEHNESDLD